MAPSTTSPTGRTASAPGYGAARDAFLIGIVTAGGALLRGLVTKETGSPELGELAGQGVEAYGPAVVGGIVAVIALPVIYLRKLYSEARARLGA